MVHKEVVPLIRLVRDIRGQLQAQYIESFNSGRYLFEPELQKLAQAQGFVSWAELREHFDPKFKPNGPIDCYHFCVHAEVKDWGDE